MTTDYDSEFQHEYQLRLGMMGLGPEDSPNAEQRQHAFDTANAHIEALKIEDQSDSFPLP